MHPISRQTLSDVTDKVRFGDRRSGNRFSLEARLDALPAIINAFSCAHNKNLFHYDIKHTNVIIVDRG
ncbi:MAG: hypothetical protein CMM01_18140 [Rhodopirellula sp.]|nr:hypothetical protein [Rhodopirellula sp.]